MVGWFLGIDDVFNLILQWCVNFPAEIIFLWWWPFQPTLYSTYISEISRCVSTKYPSQVRVKHFKYFFHRPRNSVRRHNANMLIFSKCDRSVCLSGIRNIFCMWRKITTVQSIRGMLIWEVTCVLKLQTASKYLAKMMRYRSHKKAKANTCSAVMNCTGR